MFSIQISQIYSKPYERDVFKFVHMVGVVAGIGGIHLKTV